MAQQSLLWLAIAFFFGTCIMAASSDDSLSGTCADVPTVAPEICKTLSFCDAIKPLFRPIDQQTMLGYKMDLWNYDSVKQNAQGIFVRLQDGSMPCDGAWPADKIQTFQNWMVCDYPGGEACEPSDQDMFYKILNIEAYPEFRDQAFSKTQKYLNQTAELIANIDVNDPYMKLLTRFNYSKDVFDKRMDEIYSYIAEDSTKPTPYITTREEAIFRLIQMSPLNLIDGAWILNCCPPGPMDEIHAMLWGILNEENGMGDASKHHGFLWKSLMESVGIYLPPVNSQDFVYDQDWVPSAFIQSAYALGIMLFTRDLFPELLGLTLQIEWTVVGSRPSILSLSKFGISPHFYELHVGIDNGLIDLYSRKFN